MFFDFYVDKDLLEIIPASNPAGKESQKHSHRNFGIEDSRHFSVDMCLAETSSRLTSYLCEFQEELSLHGVLSYNLMYIFHKVNILTFSNEQ